MYTLTIKVLQIFLYIDSNVFLKEEFQYKINSNS